MGAFDGLKIPYDSGYSSAGFNNPHRYFPNYCFSFFDGFGEPELRELLAVAEAKGSDTVWVPQERKERGRIGLDTRYVTALLEYHFGVE